MFRDVDDSLNLARGTLEHLNFTEILYADDTVLITNNVNAMNRLLAKIEHQATQSPVRIQQAVVIEWIITTPLPLEQLSLRFV